MSKTAPAGGRKVTFNVSEQYEIQEIVGEGAYGVVWYEKHYKVARNGKLTLPKLSTTQAITTKGCHQKDYTIRPLHVLPANIT